MDRTAIKNLKPGSFVMIEGAPCRVEKVSVSVSGKHGAAKARVEAIGLFDGRRRSIVKPADEEIEVPIIERKRAQVLAILGDRAQIMDLETYETFELDIPEEMQGQLQPGQETFYYTVDGMKTLKQLK